MQCKHARRVAGLACCALAAAMPALARSAVTVNGLLDIGAFRGFDGLDQIGTIQRSNIAISGSETLGGGTTLVFRLSTRLELDTGSSEDAQVKPFWHDEATVGLRGRWGTLRVGRAMTAMWAQDWKFDPWANFNRIASPAWYLWHCLTPSDPFGNRGTAEYGRLDSGVFYDSPTVAGLSLRMSGTLARRPAPGATARPYSVVLDYGRGPLAAMAAFERNSIGDKDGFLAAKFGAGAVAVMAALDDSRRFDGSARSRAATLGASYRLGSSTLKAGYGRQRLDTEAKRFASLGVDYAVSRRTTVYASLGRQRNACDGATTAYGVGMAHAF